MPYDPFQIALEHHRAGRLVQAEAAYRDLIARDANHPEALHWLGVLLYQAGQASQAAELMERAVALRPGDTAFQSNFAQACLAAGRNDDAIVAFARARALGVDSAELSFGLGVALHRAGRVDDAVASLADAVMKNPNHAPAYYHLAAAYRTRNAPKEVRKYLNKALEIDPDLAPAWQALGVLEAESANAAQAQAALQKAARIRQQQSARGAGASVADLQRRLTPDPAARQLHQVLADATGLAAPANLPPEQIAALFDRYADSFDEHLREKLDYRAPELLVEAIARFQPDHPLDILDLGCGTGLCGPLLKPFARTLRGIDLSSGMIAKAKARGVYDHLEVGDLIDALKHSPGAFDLLIAADVLNYLGDLAPVMEVAGAALRPGGLFAFTLEAFTGERFQLQRATHRYAHSRPYIEHVTKIFGFDIRLLDSITPRTDAGQPVSGYLIVLQKNV